MIKIIEKKYVIFYCGIRAITIQTQTLRTMVNDASVMDNRHRSLEPYDRRFK